MPSNSEVVQNQVKFCMFLTRKIFGEGPPKFKTGIIKFNLLLIIVQNFTLIGSEVKEKEENES